MRYTIFILSLLFPFLSIVAQPKHEVRAAWVTAVYGLDWPRTRATTPQTIRKQKEELIDILDKLKAANFNTILFQTRTRERCIISFGNRTFQFDPDRKDRRKSGI